MIARIPWLQYALNFFQNIMLIRQICSKLYELFTPYKGSIINLYIVILSRILNSRQNHVFCYISIYF